MARLPVRSPPSRRGRCLTQSALANSQVPLSTLPVLQVALGLHCHLRSDGQDAQPDFPNLGKGIGHPQRTTRVRTSSPEEKERTAALNHYKELAPEERKRQFSALDRRMKRDQETLPPGLLQQYQSSYGSPEKKLELVSLRLWCNKFWGLRLIISGFT